MKLHKVLGASPAWHGSTSSAKAVVADAKLKWRERIAAAKAAKDKVGAKEPFTVTIEQIEVPTKKEELIEWLNRREF